ncbi:MAG: hypothetical protein IT379_00220 [Deltaproteobacteria bacterium]|nr:hypothetical protein [Deltaproteobacteria bacterium]
MGHTSKIVVRVLARGASCLLLVGAIAAIGACGDDSNDECETIDDCALGEVCTEAHRCAPAPSMRCETDVDCRDAPGGVPSLCGAAGACEPLHAESCPDDAVLARVCAVTGAATFCVDRLLVTCGASAGDEQCELCPQTCSPDGCTSAPDAGDAGPTTDDGGPPDASRDGRVEMPADAAPIDASDAAPAPVVCGDSIIGVGEDCDPPAPPECGQLRGCGVDCRFEERVAVCGDGCLEGDETCGDAVSGGCPGGERCDACACVVARCGDGIVDSGEVCGEPGLAECVGGSACTGCLCAALCGDGDSDPGEECGEPTLPACGSDSTCTSCRCALLCGNGALDPGEACDPPSAPTCASSSYCSEQCETLPRPRVCGNGCQDVGEECGEPGTSDCPGAAPCVDCVCTATCGNGVVEIRETCDPPTAPTCAPTFCDASCATAARPTVCGDGCRDATEQCESDRDCIGVVPGCDVDTNCRCTSCGCAWCGDGVWDPAFEFCDPGDGSVMPHPGCGMGFGDRCFGVCMNCD